MFVIIVTSIKYLARQGISLRGDGDEENSNFMQLLRLRADDDPNLLTWLQRKHNKYTSHEIQGHICLKGYCKLPSKLTFPHSDDG